MSKIRIIDVAQKAGVSKSSVSNYLNGKSEKLSKTTAKKIQNVIEELNYAPNLAARNISNHQKTKTIGIIMPETLGETFSSRFDASVMQGISDAVEAAGYRTILLPCHRHENFKDVEYIRGLSRGLVDGFLLFGIEKGDRFIKEMDFDQVPYVCFGISDLFFEDLRYVASDHTEGMRQAAGHMITEHGAKEIALFLGPKNLNVHQQKLAGYTKALTDSGLKINENLIHWEMGRNYDIFQNTITLLSHGHRFFIIPQNRTPSFIRACQNQHLIIGKDVFFVLSEFYDLGIHEEFNYTRLEYPIYDIGAEGVNRLIQLIEGSPIKKENILYPAALVIGKTCGCSL